MRREIDGRRAAPLLFAALVALLYGMTLRSPFVYDDRGLAAMSLAGRSTGETARALVSRRYFALTGERTYQPLVTALHHWVASPAPLRALGWLVHAVNGSLVFFIGLALGLEEGAAALAAALFLAFPLQTEAVNISSFKGHLLAAAFGLAGLRLWLAADRQGAGQTARRVGAYVLLALSLAAKETGVVFVALVAAHAVLLGPRRSRRELGARLVGLAALAAAYLAWRFVWLLPPPALPESFARPTAASFAWYLSRLVAPWPACLEHSLSWTPWMALALAAFLACCRAARRDRRALFCLAWIVVALLPYLHFVPFANFSPVADRYLYVPVAGFALLVAGLAERQWARLSLAVVVAVWGALTAVRNGLYREPIALYAQTVQCAPRNPRAHYLFALARYEIGDFLGAADESEASLELKDSGKVRTLLGDSLRGLGQDRLAAQEFRKARLLLPDWDAQYPEESRFLGAPRR